MTSEEVVHEARDGRIVEVQGAPASLERGGREQAAVEEGDAAEGACRRRAIAPRGVERAEEEWTQQPAMHVAAQRERLVAAMREERPVPSSQPFASRNARKRQRVAYSSASSERAAPSGTVAAADAASVPTVSASA
jgi:hypothetical protein